MSQDPTQRAQEVQAKYSDMLMSKPHVQGIGVGLATEGGQFTDKIAIVVMVDEKVPASELAPEDLIPKELDGIPVDVQVMGTFWAQ
jgi:hypothetical protein